MNTQTIAEALRADECVLLLGPHAATFEGECLQDLLADRMARKLGLPFAARGGLRRDVFEYSGSDTVGSVAWYVGDSNSRTQPTGAKKNNGAGIFDMSGNVWEWCYDWHGNLPAENAVGAKGGANRVVRGGGWRFAAGAIPITAPTTLASALSSSRSQSAVHTGFTYEQERVAP